MRHAIFGALVAFIALAYRLGKEQARRETRHFHGLSDAQDEFAQHFFKPINFDIEREIVGALRSTIAAHGPITKDLLGSASKRVAGALLAPRDGTELVRCELRGSEVVFEPLERP